MAANSLLHSFSFWLLLIAAPLLTTLAADPDPLKDYCVADFSQNSSISGFPCKNADNVTIEDFVFQGLRQRGNASSSPVNATATFAFVEQMPGLNSLGLGMARLDFGVGGLIVPHTHPRGSETIFVVEGSLYAGFVDTKNKLFAQVIQPGDVMIFPRGLIHFQLNVGTVPAVAVVALNSQDAGFQVIANSMFGSSLPVEVLEKTFFMKKKEVEQLQSIFTSSS